MFHIVLSSYFGLAVIVAATGTYLARRWGGEGGAPPTRDFDQAVVFGLAVDSVAATFFHGPLWTVWTAGVVSLGWFGGTRLVGRKE